MCWLKRDLWKACIAIASILLLLLLMIGISVSAAGAQEGASGLAIPVTISLQATPTEDATVTALNKVKLAQEVQQLKNQNAPDPLGWLRTNASILLSTLVVVVGALFGFWRWRVDRRDAQDKELEDRRDEREKRAEERFQAVVTGLGDDKEGAKIGAAILLRTFLRPGYEQFYTQVFDLAVAHSRLPKTPSRHDLNFEVAHSRLPRTLPPSEDPDGLPHQPEDPNIPVPLTTLSLLLIDVFKEAFPRARDRLKEQDPQSPPSSLDASGIQIDDASLWNADLKEAWMPWASLRNADLRFAKLSRANLVGADLGDANLFHADLQRAELFRADLRNAYLREADLSGAILGEADLREADLRKVNLEDTHSLKRTDLRGAKGMTKEQLEACKAKGAIIDEDSPVSSSQSTVSPFSQLQSNMQARSTKSAQGSTPTPDTDESNAASS